MFITKMSMPRRTLLRGMGAALALPLLDAMVPALSAMANTAAKPVRRLGVIYVPNGMAMEYWTPKTEGSGFDLPVVLQPLEPFRDRLLVVSGLRGPTGGAHAGGSTLFLTGAPPKPSEVEVEANVSVDQVVARELGKYTQLSSLELSLDGRSNAGQCCAGYSCAYTNTISWRGPSTPLPMENNPRAIFERLFGDTGSTNQAARLSRIQEDRSLLDSITEKASRLSKGVGPRDRAKLDEYLAGVRDVERRIQKAEEQSAKELPVMDQPPGVPAAFSDYTKLMFDMQLLAYQTDMTRVITFMLGRELSGRTFPEIGVPDAHHPLSHHENDPIKIATMSKINTYHMSLFANFVERLQSTPDGDGSLLDHTTLLYGAGISNSNAHAHDDLPVLLMGGGVREAKGGRHLRYPGDTPLANLLVSVAEMAGVPVDGVGNSTGKLAVEPLTGV